MEGLFGVVPEPVLCHPQLNGTDVRVYAVIAMRAGARGWCWPSLRDLAAQAHVSSRSVRRATNKLEAARFISREYHDGRLIYLVTHKVFNMVFNGGDNPAPPGDNLTPPPATSGHTPRPPVATRKGSGKNKKTHARTSVLPPGGAREGAREGGDPEPKLSTGEARVVLDPEARVNCTGAFAPFSSEEVLSAVPEFSAAAVQHRMEQINRKAKRGLKIKDPIGYLVASLNAAWVEQ